MTPPDTMHTIWIIAGIKNGSDQLDTIPVLSRVFNPRSWEKNLSYFKKIHFSHFFSYRYLLCCKKQHYLISFKIKCFPTSEYLTIYSLKIRFALGDVESKYIHSCVISRKNPNLLSSHSVPARQTTVSVANPTLQLQAVWGSSGDSISPKMRLLEPRPVKTTVYTKLYINTTVQGLQDTEKAQTILKPKTKRSLEFTDGSSKQAFNKHLNKMYSLSPASSK